MGLLLEKAPVALGRWVGVEGSLKLPVAFWSHLAAAPADICPEFSGPPGYKWKDARGKDHPRLGRFVYAFAKATQPERIVEVGTNTGGSAIGWARALQENGHGQLICVDSDVYSHQVYPRGIQMNLEKMRVANERVDLRRGDSRELVPQLAREFPKSVDIYFVDGDHSYEGARADLYNGLPMVRPGGYLFCHDIDRGRPMNEATPEHPFPVYEPFMALARENGFAWCICKFVRKHLGIIQVR